jgi:hypothetical protein
MKWFFVFALIIASLLPNLIVSAATPAPQVNILNASGAVTSSFTPFQTSSNNLIGGITTADLGNDGINEIIIGAGPGSAPNISVFRQDGSLIGSFLAYGTGFTGGVNVAACDVDGDGTTEIISGTHFSGGPQVRIFDSLGNVKYPGFFAYSETFRGGVNIACSDINADGQADIITGAGLTGGPHIKVFNQLGTMKYEIFNGSAFLNTGSFVAVQDGTIIASPVSDQSTVSSFSANRSNLFSITSISQLSSHDLFSSANLDHNQTITADVSIDRHHETIAQYILVDTNTQTLSAYEYGIPVNNFLVSTGVYSRPTPLGVTDVREKLLWHDYNWFYGVDNPNNYSLPNVKYNLRIYDHIYIHYAYWHNNFGHKMSHGCINVNYANSEWIYNWANIGAAVEVI